MYKKNTDFFGKKGLLFQEIVVTLHRFLRIIFK